MTTRRLLGLVLAGAMAAGCGGGTSSASHATTTTARERTTTTAEAGDDVIAGYRAFWDAYLSASDPMNPAAEDLARTATGDELDQVRHAFADYFARDLVIRGHLDLNPEVRSQSGDSARLHDCYRDRTHLFNAKTGAQQDPADEPYFEVDVTLKRDAGVWKVARLDKRGEGCAP